MDSTDPTTSTETTTSPDTSTPESCGFQFSGLFESLSPEIVLYIMEHFDMESSIVLTRLCKALAYFFLKNSRNILCLSENKKPAKEFVQFVTRAKDTKTRVPVLLSPGILKIFEDTQINAVIITSKSDPFPECSMSNVSSMVIHLPRITSTAELFSTHSPFLNSLPIDKFGSLKSLMLENMYLPDVFLKRLENLKVEEMHWNYVSSIFMSLLANTSFASVKRFSGKYDEQFVLRKSLDIFPFVEKVVIHCKFKLLYGVAFPQHEFDLSRSKSLQYL
jgi:hypothetical protein